jgi:hypothetical protein
MDRGDDGAADVDVRADVVMEGVRQPSAISPARACIFGAVAAT